MFKYLQRLAIFAIAFFMLSGSSALAAPPTPTLLCLSVQEDGSILASWEAEDETLFEGFRLYYRPVTIPPQPSFVELNFDKTETSGPIPVINAKETQYEVFIITYDGTDIAESQTLKTIHMDVYPQAGDNGRAFVEWNPGNNTSTGNSRVYRSIDNSNFIEVGQTSANSYGDIIDGICEPTVLYYYVEFSNEHCTYRSMTGVSISPMYDNTAPADPVFKNVTINEAGLAELNWEAPASNGIEGYQIEVYNEDTGWEEHTTTDVTYSFTDNLNDPLLNPYYQDPCEQIVKYVLKAVDKCGNTSAQNVYAPTSIHNTIWLRVDLDGNCQRKATLSWNRYNNMNPPVSSYQIIRKQNGSPSIIVGSIDDDGSEEFSFTDDFLIPGELYTYHISANNAESAISSESCRVEVVADPDLLNSFDLNNVSVYNNEYIQLFGNGEPVGFINEVAIYRSATTPDDFELLTNVSWDSEYMVIPETTAEVNETAYYYQLAALDDCGYEIERSTVIRSIHLKLEDLGEGRIRLNWNAIEGWGLNLLGYNIFRMTDGIIDPDFPQNRMPGTLVYNDIIDPATTSGRITYYIEADRRNDDEKSRSNEVLLQGEAEVLMPNAFRPESEIEKNRIFTPIVKNVDPANYRFVVYNRWGQMVFETKDPLQGWDGRMKEQISPLGIYAYVVTYADYNGTTHAQRGAINLLR